MPLFDIKICKPTHAFYSNVFSASLFIDAAVSRIKRIIVRDKERSITRMNTCSYPYLVFFFFIKEKVSSYEIAF